MNVILKVTKRCNLRCRYCYERPYHQDETALTVRKVEAIFQKIRAYCMEEPGRHHLEFIWHGGEPMLLPSSFYWKVLDLQEHFFADRRKFHLINGIQTNLTLLDDDYITLFKTRRMGVVGVSFDVANQNRVYRNGRATDEVVIRNMDRLALEQIPHSGLCVISRKNIGAIDEIYRFFRNRGICFSIIPTHHLGWRKGTALGITAGEYARAARRLFDLWFYDRDAEMFITDFSVMISNLTHAEDGPGSCCYSKRCPEHTVHVDPDGTTYLCSRMNLGGYIYGNIFRQTFKEIMDSPARRLVLSRFDRIAGKCGACEFFQNCYGGCMNMGQTQGRFLEKSVLCSYYRMMFAHIRSRLSQHGLVTKEGRLRRDHQQILPKIIPPQELSHFPEWPA